MGKKAYRILGSLIPLLLLFSCSAGESIIPFLGSNTWAANPPSASPTSSALGILNWTAGLSICGGMIAMVLTSGRMGLRAIAGGVGLIILSYAISAWLHWVMIPVGIVLTTVSALWGYKIIIKAWRER